MTTFNDGNTSDRLAVNFTFDTVMRDEPSVSKSLNQSQTVINEKTTIYGYSLGCKKDSRGSMTSIDTMEFDIEL